MTITAGLHMVRARHDVTLRYDRIFVMIVNNKIDYFYSKTEISSISCANLQ